MHCHSTRPRSGLHEHRHEGIFREERNIPYHIPSCLLERDGTLHDIENSFELD